MLTKVQCDKLHELENFAFEESVRLSNEREALLKTWVSHKYDGNAAQYLAEERKLTQPFFIMSNCAKVVETKREISEDGVFQVEYHFEWDDEGISLDGFKDGITWANKHGAGIPCEEPALT